jgi:hypothetical protein
MKHLFYTTVFILLSFFAHAQPPISPAVTTEQCPGIDIQIQFTGANSPDYIIKNDATLKGCTITANINGSGHAVIKFTDKKETHSFTLYNSAGDVSYTYTFTKIKTIDGLKPTPVPGTTTPYTPDYDDAIPLNILGLCQAPTFPYTCPDLKYKDASGNEFGAFGMSFAEWVVPKGWKVNGNTSDGTTPIIASGYAADLTADPIIGGDIKYRARNNCDPNNLKKSEYYKVLILRPTMRLLSGGQTSIVVSCGENGSRAFTLENASLFSGCLTGDYVWDLGSASNGWLYNGSPAPATITTTTPVLNLSYAGGITSPSNVSVNVTHNNGSTYKFTTNVSFNACATTVFQLNPSNVAVICGVQKTETFILNTAANIAGVTGYVWSFPSTPTRWKDANGSPVISPVTTSTNSLTLTSDGGFSSPSEIKVRPQINNVPFAFDYTVNVGFTTCCAAPPANTTATPTGSNGYVILGWDAVLSASSYTVEYMATDGSNHNTFTTTFTTTSYYGPSTVNGQFRVKATCASGQSSDWTPWKTFLTTQPVTCNLATPTNLVASNACSPSLCGYVYYNWSSVSGATNYEVEAVVFNISTGQVLPTTTFQTSSTSIYYGTYSGANGTGWSIHFRVRVKCANDSWTPFSNWSPTYAL